MSKISLTLDHYPDGRPEWLARADRDDGSPEYDGSGATPEIALAELAKVLADALLDGTQDRHA